MVVSTLLHPCPPYVAWVYAAPDYYAVIVKIYLVCIYIYLLYNSVKLHAVELSPYFPDIKRHVVINSLCHTATCYN